jgi:hypothetical protein
MRCHAARPGVFVAVLLAALPVPVAAEAAAPTAFEALATHPDTVVASSREVGSLASVDSTLTVTVLVAAARTDAARRMRGARFDLRNNGGTEQVYLDARQLAKLETDVGLMELGGALAPEPATAASPGVRVLGTEACWLPQPVQRILCPELQQAPSWTGLRLWTFGGAIFEFRNRTVAELRALIERAVTELNGL